MHTEQKRLFARDQLFCGSDICKYHAFFNQAVRVQPIFEIHRLDLAVFRKLNAAFGQVKIKRAAALTCLNECCISCIKWVDDVIHKRRDTIIYTAVHRLLDFFIMKGRMRFHQPAHKPVPQFFTRSIKHHFNGDTRTRHAFMQTAQVTRQPIRQHRYDAVRKVSRIAPLACFAVKFRARSDVVGHIGNRDPKDMATCVCRIGVSHGKTGVIVIACV